MSLQNELSVVIIAKNEEKKIARCIESVLKATKDFDGTDIILVDSASSDCTLAIAMKYPIKILQLRPEWQLSAGAGRYIGSLNAKGKYIYFQDGDGAVYEDWFKKALPILKKDEQVAGVVGIITQEPYPTKMAKQWTESNCPEKLVFGDIMYFAGESLFKKEQLIKVGSFNPYIKIGEEGELSSRIISAGYKLIMLPHLMSHHYGYDRVVKAVDQILNARYQGRILRYSMNNSEIFWNRLWEYKFKLLSVSLIVFGFLSAGIFLALNKPLPLYIWSSGWIFYFGWVFYEVRKVRGTLYHMITQTMKSIPFLYGFLESKRDIKSYPTNVKIIK